MKICILSIGRSGSTSLYNVIRHHLKSEYYCISEPFNFSYNRVNKIEENQKRKVKESPLITLIL